MSLPTPRLNIIASTGVSNIVVPWSKTLAIALLVCLATIVPRSFASHCDREIRVNNMLSNAVFTLLFRGVNGEIHNWGDVGESLTIGASTGHLFFKSREMISAGDESRGMAMAYLASSITENVSYGRHPLSHFRYGAGPVEVKWATPFAEDSGVGFSLNAIDTIGLLTLAASGQANNFKFRNGILVGEDTGSMNENFSAYALNRTIVMRPEHANDQGLWHHEMIHTTQYLQYSSFGSNNFDVVDWEKVDMFGIKNRIARSGVNMNLRVEWFNSVINSLDHERDYGDRNRELEAARLAQDTWPWHDDHDHTCSAEVGFQFEF